MFSVSLLDDMEAVKREGLRGHHHAAESSSTEGFAPRKVWIRYCERSDIGDTGDTGIDSVQGRMVQAFWE